MEHKPRSAGAAKPLIGNQRTEEQQETPEKLQFMIEAYGRQLRNATNDKVRLTDLMARKSANGWISQSRHPRRRGKWQAGWDSTKKTKMVRRFMRAEQMINECNDALDKLKHRLSQITTEPNPNLNVAPFVPPPATSVEG